MNEINENNNLNNKQNLNTNTVINTVPVVNSEEKFNTISPTVNNQNIGIQPVNNATPPTINNQNVQVQPVDNKVNNAQKETKEYIPPSKLKVVALVMLFIALVIFIIFLPDISSMIRNYKSGNMTYQKNEIITTGKLICTLNTNTEDLDKDYELVFNFTESKLKSEKFVITTRDDSTSSEDELNKLADTCNKLSEGTKDLDGVSIRCTYSNGKLVETQSFSLEEIDTEKLDAVFTEAGGILPTYQYNQDIDGIEKNMKASGYTCERK